MSLFLFAFNTNATFANLTFDCSLSILSIKIFVVCFQLRIEILSPEPPDVLSVSLDDTLFACAHPRFATVFKSEVILLFVTVPLSEFVASNVTV